MDFIVHSLAPGVFIGVLYFLSIFHYIDMSYTSHQYRLIILISLVLQFNTWLTRGYGCYQVCYQDMAKQWLCSIESSRYFLHQSFLFKWSNKFFCISRVTLSLDAIIIHITMNLFLKFVLFCFVGKKISLNISDKTNQLTK